GRRDILHAHERLFRHAGIRSEAGHFLVTSLPPGRGFTGSCEEEDEQKDEGENEATRESYQRRSEPIRRDILAAPTSTCPRRAGGVRSDGLARVALAEQLVIRPV